MINTRSILWGCAVFHLRDEAFGGCAILWVKHFLPFAGVPFQIEGNWASLKGVSYSFSKIGVTLKQKGQLRQFSFWWVKPFLQIHFQRKGQWLFKEILLFAKYRIAVFWERGVTLFSFKDMVLPSKHIYIRAGLWRECYFFSRHKS